jgi:tetratricopeptide (TPR) repeat protein
MPEAATRPLTLPHAVFLERATTEPPTSVEVRLGQGAFLVLRLVDLLAPDRDPPTSTEVFRYQSAATGRYCVELGPIGPEATHLQGLVQSAEDAFANHDPRVIAPGMLAYAHFLEDGGRYLESLDVLETLLRAGRERLRDADQIATALRVGRVNRKMQRFDEAERWYATGGELASRVGDAYSVLLSRLGHANVLHYRGNLAECERVYRAILIDSQHQQCVAAEARAEHGLGATLAVRGQPEEAIPHLWRGVELYEDQPSRMRSFHDLGVAMMKLGDAAGAERALLQVVQHETTADNLSNTIIELMYCASYRRDRVGFERWRERCEAVVALMAPNMHADFLLKSGIGFARFDSFAKAERLLGEALRIASANQLHALEFKIERIKTGLRDCEVQVRGCQETLTEPVLQTDAVREVSASLAALSV